MKFRDLIPNYPYETVMRFTSMTRDEIDQEIDRIFVGLPEEEKRLLRDTETLLDVEEEHR